MTQNQMDNLTMFFFIYIELRLCLLYDQNQSHKLMLGNYVIILQSGKHTFWLKVRQYRLKMWDLFIFPLGKGCSYYVALWYTFLVYIWAFPWGWFSFQRRMNALLTFETMNVVPMPSVAINVVPWYTQCIRRP